MDVINCGQWILKMQLLLSILRIMLSRAQNNRIVVEGMISDKNMLFPITD